MPTKKTIQYIDLSAEINRNTLNPRANERIAAKFFAAIVDPSLTIQEKTEILLILTEVVNTTDIERCNSILSEIFQQLSENPTTPPDLMDLLQYQDEYDYPLSTTMQNSSYPTSLQSLLTLLTSLIDKVDSNTLLTVLNQQNYLGINLGTYIVGSINADNIQSFLTLLTSLIDKVDSNAIFAMLQQMTHRFQGSQYSFFVTNMTGRLIYNQAYADTNKQSFLILLTALFDKVELNTLINFLEVELCLNRENRSRHGDLSRLEMYKPLCAKGIIRHLDNESGDSALIEVYIRFKPLVHDYLLALEPTIDTLTLLKRCLVRNTTLSDFCRTPSGSPSKAFIFGTRLIADINQRVAEIETLMQAPPAISSSVIRSATQISFHTNHTVMDNLSTTKHCSVKDSHL